MATFDSKTATLGYNILKGMGHRDSRAAVPKLLEYVTPFSSTKPTMTPTFKAFLKFTNFQWPNYPAVRSITAFLYHK